MSFASTLKQIAKAANSLEEKVNRLYPRILAETATEAELGRYFISYNLNTQEQLGIELLSLDKSQINILEQKCKEDGFEFNASYHIHMEHPNTISISWKFAK